MSDTRVWPDPQEMSTKERILYEAEHLFAAKGFSDTGIDEIARKTGITKSVIYYHFKNKEAILNALFERYAERGKKAKESLGKEFISNPARLRDILDRSFRVLDAGKWPKMASILLMESIKSGREELLFELWDENLEHVNELFGEYMKRSGMLEDDEKYRFASFYLLFMPQLTYTVFAERWSKHYDIDPNTLRNWFVEIFSALFQEVVFPAVYDENKLGSSNTA